MQRMVTLITSFIKAVKVRNKRVFRSVNELETFQWHRLTTDLAGCLIIV